jgi:hypothetical protein
MTRSVHYQVSIAQSGGARLLAVLVILGIGGCQITVRYLNPQGVGTSRTVGNPCPYTYRTMEIRSTRDPDIRVSVSAFRKGEYRLKSTTLFVVSADRELWGRQLPSSARGHSEIDGENTQLGTVTFTRASETLYFSAC